MEVQVHAGNGGSGQVVLLAINAAVGEAVIVHVTDCLNQHTTSAAGGIVYRFAGLRVQQIHHQFDDSARGVKFSGILFGHVRELFDQEFVAVAHNVRGVVFVSHSDLGHVLDQVLQALVGQLVLVGPSGIVKTAEYAGQGFRVGLFYPGHGIDNGFANILGHLADIVPMAAGRDHERVHLLCLGILHIAAGKSQRICVFFIINIRNSLEKKDRRHIAFVLILVDGTAQNVAGFKQMIEQLLAGSLFGFILGRLYVLVCSQHGAFHQRGTVFSRDLAVLFPLDRD